jgi:WD40 repeat protein
VIDSEDGTLIRPLTAGRPGEGTNIAYSPCGEFLIDGTWAGLLAVRAVATGKIVFQTGFPGEMICQIVPNADKDTWFILHKPIAISRDVSGAPAYVSIWNWPFTAPAGFLTSPLADLWTLSLSPDGRRICMRGSQEIAIVDIAQKQPVAARSLIGGGTGFQTCWSPDAKELAIVTDGQVSFHDAGELEVRRTVAIPFASDVAYSSDGRFVALGSWQNGMLIDRTTPVAC